MGKPDPDVVESKKLVTAYLKPEQSDKQEAFKRTHDLIRRVREVKPLKTKQEVREEIAKVQRQTKKLVNSLGDLSDEAIEILRTEAALSREILGAIFGPERETDLFVVLSELESIAAWAAEDLPGFDTHASVKMDKRVCAMGSLILFEAFRPSAAKPEDGDLEGFAVDIYSYAGSDPNKSMDRAFRNIFELWDLHKTRRYPDVF